MKQKKIYKCVRELINFLYPIPHIFSGARSYEDGGWTRSGIKYKSDREKYERLHST